MNEEVKSGVSGKFDIITNNSVILDKLRKLSQPETLNAIAFFLAAILLIVILYLILRKIVKKIPNDRIKPRTREIILKTLRYTVEFLIVVYILNLFGVNLNAIFGAAGIAGVAIGFAAQTSLGNVISGFFLVNEKMIKIGDHVIVDGVEGYVDSIGFLAIKVKTFENNIVRIPNETLVKSNVQNFSLLPERRICLYAYFASDENFQKVIPVLLNAIRRSEKVLKTPESAVLCTNFTDKGVEVRMTAYAKYEDYMDSQSEIITNVTDDCKKNSIKIMYPIVQVKQDGAKV